MFLSSLPQPLSAGVMNNFTSLHNSQLFLYIHIKNYQVTGSVLILEGGETLAQDAQRGGRCPVPGDIQDQAGWGSEHPDPVEAVPARCRGVGWVASEGPFPPRPFCDSVILIQLLSQSVSCGFLPPVLIAKHATFWCLKLNVILFLHLQIEEALVRRKKMELLQKYASETLMAQSEEAKTLLGL